MKLELRIPIPSEKSRILRIESAEIRPCSEASRGAVTSPAQDGTLQVVCSMAESSQTPTNKLRKSLNLEIPRIRIIMGLGGEDEAVAIQRWRDASPIYEMLMSQWSEFLIEKVEGGDASTIM